LDDDTTEAKLCKANYPNVRDALLELHNWTFATKWIELNKLADPPLSEFANAYSLPSNVLRVIFVGQNYKEPVQHWQVEGNNIVTDENAAKCQVIFQQTDVTQYSPLFIQAFAQRLAGDMAIPLTNSRSLMETHMSLYGAKLRDAKTRDGLQGRSRRIRSRWLNNARAAGPSAGPYV
jgi:hypothetical protein